MRVRVIIAAVVLLASLAPLAGTAAASPAESTQPDALFTTLANRLLMDQCGLACTNIPVWPTNLYTPAVHRLLQVAANLVDATQPTIYPSVFRPLITSNAAGIFVRGYTNDWRRSTLPDWLAVNRRYGVPLIVGAKKGFPNFNEFTLQTDVQVTRKLQFVRPNTNSPPTQTNQMYILGISNLFAAEGWNSYQAAYPRTLQLEVTDMVTVTLTNAAGLQWNMPVQPVVCFTNIPPGGWHGGRFLLPICANVTLLAPSAYRFSSLSFEPVSGVNAFEAGFPVPGWNLSISNQFLYVLTEPETDHLVDVVLTMGFNSSLDIDGALMPPAPPPPSPPVEESLVARLWDTNRFGGSASMAVPTLGVRNQIAMCLGMVLAGEDIWSAFADGWAYGQDKARVISACQQFFRMGSAQDFTNSLVGTNLVLQAPLSPIRKLVKTITWQVNDPLVHYQCADLQVNPNWHIDFIASPTAPLPTNMPLASLGRLNQRYSPWGGNPEVNSDPFNPIDPDAYNMTIKDPLVRSSDDWDFPSGEPLDLEWLGRVHRGTPWQTIYLKSTAVSAGGWQEVSSDPATHPTNDWAIARSLALLWNTNPPQRLVSINEANPSILAGVFQGVTVLTNVLSDAALLAGAPAEFGLVTMSSNMAQAATLTEAIRHTRSAQEPQRFHSLADLLATPELTITSPWLNNRAVTQWRLGLDDASLEAIPGQILGRFREEDLECSLVRGDRGLMLELKVPWPGATCELESSTDLQQWTRAAGPHSPTNGLIVVELPEASGPGWRFYRGKLIP